MMEVGDPQFEVGPEMLHFWFKIIYFWLFWVFSLHATFSVVSGGPLLVAVLGLPIVVVSLVEPRALGAWA